MRQLEPRSTRSMPGEYDLKHLARGVVVNHASLLFSHSVERGGADGSAAFFLLYDALLCLYSASVWIRWQDLTVFFCLSDSYEFLIPFLISHSFSWEVP